MVRRALVAFSQVTSDRTQENGLKLHQGGFKLEIRKKKWKVLHWNRLMRGVVKSSSLEILRVVSVWH